MIIILFTINLDTHTLGMQSKVPINMFPKCFMPPQIANRRSKVINNQTSIKQLNKADSIIFFDDAELAVQKNTPIVYKTSLFRQASVSNKNKNKSQLYYYRKLITHQKNMQISLQLRERIKKTKQSKQKQHKLITQRSFEQFDNYFSEKTPTRKIQTSQHNKKLRSQYPSSFNQNTTHKQIFQFNKNETPQQRRYNKQRNVKKDYRFKQFENSLPLRFSRETGLFVDSRQQIRIDQVKSQSNKFTAKISEPVQTIHKQYQQMAQSTDISKSSPNQKSIGFQQWKSKFRINKKTTLMVQPTPRQHHNKISRKFNWKKQNLPKIYTTLTLNQVCTIFRKYLGIGEVKELKFGFYRAYVGQGNNNQAIKRLLKQRGYWKIVDSLQQNPHFVWTQSNWFKKIYPHNTQINQYTHIQPYKQIRQKNRISADLISKKQLQLFINLKNNSFIDGCQKLVTRYKFESYMLKIYEKFKNGQNISCFRKLQEYLFQNIQESDQQVISNHLKVHNHITNAQQISHKKSLFNNLTQYLNKNGQNRQNFLPQTIHLNQSHKLTKQELEQRQLGNGPWILKPGQYTNRGRGITVHMHKDSLIEQVLKLQIDNQKYQNSRTCIIQRYLQPCLYQNRKFDIRVWVLWTKGKLWWYREGYCRTSCKQFTYQNTNKFVHLTNDAIQAQCSDYGKFQPANKLSFSELHRYLSKFYKYEGFFKYIVPQIKRITQKIFEMGSYHFSNGHQQNKSQKNYHDFELFGLDFMIDKNFKVWLIECNNNPCLQTNCSLLSRLVPNLLDNIFFLTIDQYFPPPLKKKFQKAQQWYHQSFKFELLSTIQKNTDGQSTGEQITSSENSNQENTNFRGN